MLRCCNINQSLASRLNDDNDPSSPSKKKLINAKPGENGVRNGGKGYAPPPDDFLVDRLVDVDDDEEVLYKRRGIGGDEEDDDLVLNTHNNKNGSMEKWDVTRPATCLQSFKCVEMRCSEKCL